MDYLLATWQTVYMSFVSAFFALVIGLPLGVILVLTDTGGLRENKRVYHILDAIINVFRSIPILILIIMLFPLSRFIVGRSTGTTAVIVPLVFSAAPFVARIMEQSLNELDSGVIEAAKSMGVSHYTMVRHVMLPEALPSIVNGVTIVLINLIGYSAIAGAIGGGGLGDLALQFGYYRRDTLFLSAGNLRRIRVFFVREIDIREEFLDARIDFTRALSESAERERNVLVHRALMKEIEMLENHADLFTLFIERFFVHRGHVFALKEHATLVGSLEQIEAPYQRRFARTAQSDKTVNFAVSDLERNVLDRFHRTLVGVKSL